MTTENLRRGLGPVAAMSVVVGTVIGTGVFLKARAMTCNVESPMVIIGVWIAAGLLSLAGVLTYAELGAMMPRAGGEYVYIGEAYGPMWGFLNGWTSYVISYSASQAAKATAFAIFLNVVTAGALERKFFAFHVGTHEIAFGTLQIVALVVLGTVVAINCAAVTYTGRVVVFLTAIKVTLVVALAVGIFAFANGDWMHLAMRNTGGTCAEVSTARGGMLGIAAAMLGALWAYDGWSNLAALAGEVKKPDRDLPLGLIGGLTLVAILYVAVNIGYYYALTPTEVASVSPTSSVATEAARRFLGSIATRAIAAVMLVSTLGSLNSGVLAGSRFPFAMAKDGLFFRRFGQLNAARVPAFSIIVLGCWAAVLAVSGSFDTLTDYAMFASWVFYLLATASVFVFRRRRPDAPRPYRTWGYPVVPFLFLVVAAWLLINTLWTRPLQSAIGLVLIVLGLPVYYICRKRNGEET